MVQLQIYWSSSKKLKFLYFLFSSGLFVPCHPVTSRLVFVNVKSAIRKSRPTTIAISEIPSAVVSSILNKIYSNY